MRTFLISLVLLLITIGLCLWSFFAVTDATCSLYTLAEQIPIPATESDLRTPAFSAPLLAFRARYESARTLLSIGISKRTLAEIERNLVEAESYALAGDVISFQAARAQLLLSISHLRHLERTVL